MKNIAAIFRREFATYFNSPIGYIFIIVFLVINAALFITEFFVFPRANMRSMFNTLPILLCILVPLVSMRLWAEEKRENTIEMLLTFPMQPSQLVLGKFFASLTFFTLALAATATIPLMLGILGRPDWGIIFSSYLGAFFLGAFFLALGGFISALVRDQIVAAVLSLAACFILFLLGMNFAAERLDALIPSLGLGTNLKQFVAFTNHYEGFTRGIVSIPSALYFITWTTLFLFLNGMFLEGRMRKGANLIFSTAFGLCMLIGVTFNYIIVDLGLGRLDFTENKIFTISPVSSKIFQKLDSPVQVNFYITPRKDMPTKFQDLEDQVMDKLNELKLSSGGKMSLKLVHMQARKLFGQVKNEEEESEYEKTLEKTMLDKGLKPFEVKINEGESVTNQLVYSAVGIAYKDKEEAIIPAVVLGNLHKLEYLLMSAVFKQTLDRKRKVVLVAPKETVVIPPHIRQIYEQMGQPLPQSEDPYQPLESLLGQDDYEVVRAAITKKEPLPAEYDALIVINPRSLNDRQRWEIGRALQRGKNVFMAVQQQTFNYRLSNQKLDIQLSEEEPKVNELLTKFGVTVDTDILLDVNNIPLGVSDEDDPFGSLRPIQLPFPMHLLITKKNLNSDEPVIKRLSEFLYVWGTAIKLDKKALEEKKLSAKVLASTSDQAWTLPNTTTFRTQQDMDPPKTGQKQYPILVEISGQFPELFPASERPKWPKETPKPGMPPQQDLGDNEPPAVDFELKPGSLTLMGCSTTFRKEFVQMGIFLFMNIVESIALNPDLAEIRPNPSDERLIDRPSDGVILVWRLIQFLLMPIIIFVFGISRFAWRKVRRENYSVQMQTA